MGRWEMKTLDELCEIARGGSPRPIKQFLTDAPDGVNWIKIGDATASTKYICETKQKIKPEGVTRSRLVHEGDFLLSNSMSFGRPYIMKTSGAIHDGWLVLSDKSGLFDQDYLYHFLGSDAAYHQFDARAVGSTVRNLNIDLVRSVEVPIPPLPEQKRIVAILDEAFAAISTATANAERNLASGRELFESELNRVFSEKGDGWVEKTLGDLVNITHGFAFKGPTFGKSNDESKPIVLTPGNYAENGTLVFSDKNTKRLNVPIPEGYLFDVGDLTVVMTDLSSKMKILGKPAFIARPNILHNQRIGRLCFTDNSVLPRLVFYFLRTKSVSDEIQATATGTMVRHTAPKRILGNILVMPREREKQKRVVSRLDDLSCRCDRLESIYQQKLDALAELKQSILHKAFAGELTADHVLAEAGV
ncbi:restriction endonuclease subunit S [Candidatus Hydrogenedentota bacterium]